MYGMESMLIKSESVGLKYFSLKSWVRSDQRFDRRRVRAGIPTRVSPPSAMSDSEERTAQQAAARIVRGLAYTTSKFTRIKDWRLAVFFYFCQLAVLVGIVASLIVGKTFLALEVPIGVISSYASTPPAYATHQAATSAGTITAPCGNLVRPPRGNGTRDSTHDSHDPTCHRNASKSTTTENARRFASPLVVLGR